jgi:transcriptional regulator with XRE-family HTH domain
MGRPPKKQRLKAARERHEPPESRQASQAWQLREWREHRNLSQESLGAMIGYTQGMISQLETGDVDFTGEHLQLLSGALNISIYQLLFQSPDVADDVLAIYDGIPDDRKPLAIDVLKSFLVRRT